MAEGVAPAPAEARLDPASRARMSWAWRERMLFRVQDMTEWPLIVLAAVLVPLLAGRMLFDITPTTDLVLRELTSLIWAAYALNLLLIVAVAPDRLALLRSRRMVLDELMAVLPLLHAIFEGSRFDDAFHVARLVVAVLRVVVGIQRVVRQPGLPYSLLAVVLVVLIAGTFVPIVERDSPEATILTLSDGIWWSLETITTVGYGDYSPKTGLGKGLAVVLMVLGVTLYGVLAGNLAVFFARQPRSDEGKGTVETAAIMPPPARDEALLAKLDTIEQRLTRIEEELRRRQESTSGPPSPSRL